MNTKECIETRRSIRKFKADSIDHSVLEEIIKEASFAPSWKNTQIARYTAIEGDLKDKIGRECFSQYAHNGEIIQEAPMLIVLSFIKNRSGFERDGSYTTRKEGGWQMFDSGVAAQTFSLACHEHGIGGVIMGIFDDDKVAELIELPDTQEVACLIPIGYPDEAPAAPKRKETSDLLSFK